MIPYDVDPSLHTGEPAPDRLDDGFSPPLPADQARAEPAAPAQLQPVDPARWAKSPF